MMLMRNLVLSAAFVACGGVRAAITQVGLLNLSEDTEITVAEGDRYEICTLSASSVYTLTKKGAGDLYIGRVTSTNPRIDLQGGHVFIGPNLTKPALFASAAFHVDANDASTLTTNVVDDKTYVSKWSDVNGGSNYAYNNTAAKQPWVTTLENGLAMLDFGTLKNDKTSGIGASMVFDSNVEAVRAAFCVQKFHQETIDAPSSSCSQGIGCYDQGVFSPYTKPADKGPSYANGWQTFTAQVRSQTDGAGQSGGAGFGGSISVNGNVLSTVLATASAELEVLDYKIVDPQSGTEKGRANRFAKNFWDQSAGGMMIGEAALFTTALTDAQHELLSHYLMVKWIGYGIPQSRQISVGAGTSASIWNGTSYDVIGHVTQVGLLNLTEDVEITVAAGERYEICTLSASSVHKLTKKGAGDLYIGRVTSANPRIVLREGRLFVGPKLTEPELFASAAFHVDANVASTLTTSEVDDKTYVSKWSDVNGGSHYAANNTAEKQPWLTTLANGLTMLDFGALVTSSDGHYLTFDSNVTGIRAAFCVQQFHPETLAAPKCNCPQGIAYYDQSVFMPYTKPADKGPSYANGWLAVTKQVRSAADGAGQSGGSGLGGSISVNGNVLSTVLSNASADLEVIDYKIVEPDEGTDYGRAGRFAIGYANNASGGMMIGEAALFTTALTDAQHELLSHYLMVKWIGYGIPRTRQISVGEGTNAFVWNGTSYDEIKRKGLVVIFR